MTLSLAIEDFLIEQRVRGNSSATLVYYNHALGCFKRSIGDVELSEITLQICKDYYLNLADEQENSVTIQSYIRALRAFLNWLYENELIELDLCAKFKLPKATRKVIDVLTDEEITRIFAALEGDSWLDVRNKLILALMLDSGLRLNEVVTLQRRHVKLEERYLIVTGKGDKQRTVPFGDATAELLGEYMRITKDSKISALLIKVSEISFGHEPITDSAIKNMFKKLKKRADVPRLYPHLLRHTFATRYLENGGNIYTLQAILGHTSLEMVKRYLHLATNRIRRDFSRYSPLDCIKKSHH